jgi:hypothetical protein
MVAAVICDDVAASLTEEDVFTLEGVRFHFEVRSVPSCKALNLFLVLSSARKGKYTVEIYFSAPGGGEALKGEHPFIVLSNQE